MKKQDKLKIALLHLSPKKGDFHYNRLMIRAALALAEGYETQLSVTGEVAEYGYPVASFKDLRHLPYFPNSFIFNLQDVARKYKMHLLLGLLEKNREHNEIDNAAIHINAWGKLQAYYRKINLINSLEYHFYTSGEEIICTEIEGIRIGILIGEDILKKEIMKRLRDIGAEFIVLLTGGNENLIDEVYLKQQVIYYDMPIVVCSHLGRGESVCIDRLNCYHFSPAVPMVIIVRYNSKGRVFDYIGNCECVPI